MSGNFVQRGEPAIWNKFIRARAALICGADMVIELPVVFATASAEFFSHYALSLLNALGCVDYLCFGTEAGEHGILEEVAKALVNEGYSFKAELKARLAMGYSYPAARQAALEYLLPDTRDVLDKPNNILGIEYIKAIMRIDSNIKPFAIKRQGEGYHSGDHSKKLSSAKAIRAALRDGQASLAGIPDILVPFYKEHIESKDFHNYERLSPVLEYMVKTRSPEYLADILDIDEGLQNRIIEAFGREQLISKSLLRLKSKRYTYTKLQRALLHILLDITKKDFAQLNASAPHYIRVLGFRKKWECLFKAIESSTSIPIVTNIKNYRTTLTNSALKLMEKEIISTDIYNLASLKAHPKNAEFSEQIVVLK